MFAVAPAYSFITGGDPANDDAVAAAFASHLPAKSEAAVDALVDLTLPDGSPVAVEIDTNSYFLCSVVDRSAAKLEINFWQEKQKGGTGCKSYHDVRRCWVWQRRRGGEG